jgi:hypothetical protein
MLRWSHVRFEQQELLIARNFVVRKGGRREKDTKTHQARRIAMDEATAAVLAEHLERCRTRAAVYGFELAADGYVFSLNPGGRSARLPDSVSRLWRVGSECRAGPLRSWDCWLVRLVGLRLSLGERLGCQQADRLQRPLRLLGRHLLSDHPDRP